MSNDMVMALAKAYDYQKDLDDKALKKSKKELNENTKQVPEDLQFIRTWLTKQTHMNSRNDDDFLLAILRNSKFSYARAQESLTNFWTNRAEMKEFFLNRNFSNDSSMMQIFNAGIITWLPFTDDDGCRVAICRTAPWEPKKHSFEDIFKALICNFDVICEDPRVQINGVCFKHQPLN